MHVVCGQVEIKLSRQVLNLLRQIMAEKYNGKSRRVTKLNGSLFWFTVRDT